MKRKVKEQRMKYQINNRYGITTTTSEVHNRATYNQDNRNYASVNPKTIKTIKGKVNMKVMQKNRNEQKKNE